MIKILKRCLKKRCLKKKYLMIKYLTTLNYYHLIAQLIFCLSPVLLNLSYRYLIENVILGSNVFFLIADGLYIMYKAKKREYKSKSQLFFDILRIIGRFFILVFIWILCKNDFNSKTIWFFMIVILFLIVFAFSKTSSEWDIQIHKNFYIRRNLKNNLSAIQYFIVFGIIIAILFLAFSVDSYLNDEYIHQVLQIKKIDDDTILEVLSQHNATILHMIYFNLRIRIDGLYDLTTQIGLLYITCFIAIVSIFKIKIYGIEIGVLYRWFCSPITYFMNKIFPFILLGVSFIVEATHYVCVLLLILFYFADIAARYVYFIFRIHEYKYFKSVVLNRLNKEKQDLIYYCEDVEILKDKKRQMVLDLSNEFAATVDPKKASFYHSWDDIKTIQKQEKKELEDFLDNYKYYDFKKNQKVLGFLHARDEFSKKENTQIKKFCNEYENVIDEEKADVLNFLKNLDYLEETEESTDYDSNLLTDFCSVFLDFPISVMIIEGKKDSEIMDKALEIFFEFIKECSKKDKLLTDEDLHQSMFALGIMSLHFFKKLKPIYDDANFMDWCKTYFKKFMSLESEMKHEYKEDMPTSYIEYRDFLIQVAEVYLAVYSEFTKHQYGRPVDIPDDYVRRKAQDYILLIILNAIARSTDADISSMKNAVIYLTEEYGSKEKANLESTSEKFYFDFWKAVYKEEGTNLKIHLNYDSIINCYLNLEVIIYGKKKPMFFVHDAVK